MKALPSRSAAEYVPNDTAYETGDEDNRFDLRGYWLMVLERKWHALAVFLAAVLITATYTFLSTPIYQAVATVQVLKHGPEVLRFADVVEENVTSDADFNTQIKILESAAIVQNVVKRLSPDELAQLVEPYRPRFGDPPSPAAIILQNRSVLPIRLTLMTAVVFRHPNPVIAARVANLIAEEYIAYNSRVRVEESLKAVDELKDRADQQRRRVDDIATAMAAFRRQGNRISLVQSKDIVTEKLKALNLMATQTNQRLSEATVRWHQVQQWRKQGKDLAELPFIASDPKVSQLIQQVNTQKLAVAELRDRYKDKHPRMIEAMNELAQAQTELKAAIAMVAASVEAEYDNALQNDQEARKALADQESRSLDLDQHAVEYDNLDRDFRVNDQLLQSMIARMRETSVNSSIETENARIIDRATEPARPVFPRIGFNLALGALGGLVLGIVFAYFIATVDDRVKTAFDVETVVGLPLLGLIPRVERMDQPDKAQIVSNGADRMIVEAFLSLYSTLRIGDDSKHARLILVTSTIPGEGKSFITTNLAQVFASQGQRTLIVDCDLRKPNVQRSFRLRASKGVVSYCLQGAPLETLINRNVRPNLDVLTAGGRAKNPIQLLNSREFEALVAELGKRYDRVLFDTPPLGAVSDALNVVPLMDGVIYAIQFNRVKRRAAQRCVRRLLAAHIPVLGAVLNDFAAGLAGDHYVEYDRKSFKEYYDEPAEGALAGLRG